VTVANVEVLPYRLPLSRPWHTAAGTLTERAGFLVRLTNSSGRCGFGEASPVYWAGGESLACTAAALHAAAEWLGRCDGVDVLHNTLCRGARPCAATEPPAALRQSPAALCAIDTALLDLLARAAGQPLAALLSPAARTAVACNGLVSDAAPQDVEQATARLFNAGFRTIKLKVAAHPADVDRERVTAVRRASTRAVRIRLDANRGWDFATASHGLAAVSGPDIDYVEEPLDTPEPAALRALRERTGVAIALDESVTDTADLARYEGQGAIDVIVLKLARVGGPCRALRLATAAADGGLRVVCTDSLETAVGRRATVHTAAAMPGPALPVGLGGALFASDVTPDMPRAVPLVAVDGPGLGSITLTRHPDA
jgi:o-succinylbenzoate synthase